MLLFLSDYSNIALRFGVDDKVARHNTHKGGQSLMGYISVRQQQCKLHMGVYIAYTMKLF